MKRIGKKTSLPLHQIVFFSMGHVMNDLLLAIYSSYLLTFQTKVLGLPSSIVGLLWLVPTGIDAFLALLTGYFSDNIKIPYLWKFYGKRKSWHLIGCIQVGLFTPFLLMRCFACVDDQTSDGWEVVLYYGIIQLIAYNGWGLTQSNYLALIPEIATTRSEMVKLGAISSAMTLICGIYVYVVTWILLGSDNSETLSYKQRKEFMQLAIIVVATGAFFIVLFHIGTREQHPKKETKRKEEKLSISQEAVSKEAKNSACSIEDFNEDKKTKEAPNKADNSSQANPKACNSPKLVPTSVNTATLVNPSYKEDDDTRAKSEMNSKMDSNDMNTNEAGDNDMDTDALKKILRQTLPKENIEKTKDDMDEADNESFESSIYEDGDTAGFEASSHESTDGESVELFMPETFMDMVPYLSNVILSSRRCSKVSGVGVFPGHHSRSSSKIYQRSPSQARRFSKDENEGIPNGMRYSSRRSSRYNHGSPSLPCRRSSRATSKVFQRSSSQTRHINESEDFQNEIQLNSGLNSGYTHGSPSLPSRQSSRAASKVYQKSPRGFDGTNSPVDEDGHFPKGILSSRQNSRISRGSPGARHSRLASKQYQTSPLAMEEALEDPEYYYEDYSVKPPQGVRFSITSEQFCDTTGIDEIRYPQANNEKPWEKVLKSPVFFKLGGAYMFTRLAQNVTNSYMPLYLTDHLKFGKISIAYFPLIILISGVFASFCGKKLNRLLGNKWTFCLGSLMVMAASGWFYLLTKGTRLVMYIPAIMTGSGTSIMFVTTLALAAEFVDADRSSGAFLMASMSFIAKIVGGTLFCLLQEYAPKAESSDCPECTEYVRYVFSLTPGVSAFLGLVAFILFIPATIQCRPIIQMKDSEVQTDEVQFLEIPVTSTLEIIAEDEENDPPRARTVSSVNEILTDAEDIPETNGIENKHNVELENTAL